MIVCLQHPRYRAKQAPALSCKTCCHLFIQEVKRCRDLGKPLPLPRFYPSKVGDPQETSWPRHTSRPRT